MPHRIGRKALAIALVVAVGCGDDDRPAKAQIQDAAHSAKVAGQKMGAELSSALDSLEAWAKETANDVGESGAAFAQRVADKMPDTEQLVSDTKAHLAAGGAKAKEAAARLDDKLAVLKAKLATLGHSTATATKEMKDDVVRAYDDLLAEVRGALKPSAG